LHNSEFPASVFSILDNGLKQIPLITDLIFDLLMLKVNPIYTSKKMIKVISAAAAIAKVIIF
jgi:mediator of RNA polymerase II transcription subunit 20